MRVDLDPPPHRIAGFRRNLLVACVRAELVTVRFARGIIRGLEAPVASPSKVPDDGRDDDPDEGEQGDLFFFGDGSSEAEGKIWKEALEAGLDLEVPMGSQLYHDLRLIRVSLDFPRRQDVSRHRADRPSYSLL